MASLVLYGSKQDWHVWKVLVTAKYANAKIKLISDQEKNKFSFIEKKSDIINKLILNNMTINYINTINGL